MSLSNGELIEKADALRARLMELAGNDPIARQQLIEALMCWHAYAAARGDEFKSSFVIDSMAKHARQFILGPSQMIDGKHRK